MPKKISTKAPPKQKRRRGASVKQIQRIVIRRAKKLKTPGILL